MKNQARHFGRLRRAEMCTAYIFILPMFAGLLLFSIIPFIQNILYSFRKMGTFGEGTFIGLKNYQDLLKDDTFWLALQKCGCLAGEAVMVGDNFRHDVQGATDVGIAGGEDCGVLFVHGEMREKLPYDELLPALLRYVDAL